MGFWSLIAITGDYCLTFLNQKTHVYLRQSRCHIGDVLIIITKTKTRIVATITAKIRSYATYILHVYTLYAITDSLNLLNASLFRLNIEEIELMSKRRVRGPNNSRSRGIFNILQLITIFAQTEKYNYYICLQNIMDKLAILEIVFTSSAKWKSYFPLYYLKYSRFN